MKTLTIHPDIISRMKYPWLYRQEEIEAIASLLGLLPPPAPAAFDFDTVGDAEGFAGNYIRDDQGAAYGVPLAVQQVASAQYDKHFPLPMGTKPPVGALSTPTFQFKSYIDSYKFPSSSAYWYTDITSPYLATSPAWQNIKSLEAWVYNDTLAGSPLTVEPILKVEINGVLQDVNLGKVTLKTRDWKQVQVPVYAIKGMSVNNLVLRIQGSPKDVWEGQFYFDHIVAT